MKRGAAVTFMGATTALVLMTLISAFAGRVLPLLVSQHFTHFASVLLFLFFGLKLTWEGYNMTAVKSEDSDEYRAVERELALRRHDQVSDNLEKGDSADEVDARSQVDARGQDLATEYRSSYKALLASARSCLKAVSMSLRATVFSAAFSEAFMMTFAAEWGDRSQIATIAMGASKDLVGVSVGAISGHLTCTLLAVICGRLLVKRLSEKTINLAGGFAFLFFAVTGFFISL